MMKIRGFIFIASCFLLNAFAAPDWGFFGHRLINRLAVFTLPADMLKPFKDQIEYISAHAVDPDKRRYAFAGEAVRHYIDADHWGKHAIDSLPRDYFQAQLLYADLKYVCGLDTFLIDIQYDKKEKQVVLTHDDKQIYIADEFLYGFKKYMQLQWAAADNILEEPPSVLLDIKTCPDAVFLSEEKFSAYGILPYHLESAYYSLVRTFQSGDIQRIIKKCTDIGHYVGDAHVPLHTTENYNGQMTGQDGIHAFWESRLPELYALDEYDFFTGQAEYIDNPRDYFWGVCKESHLLVDSVLQVERRVKESMPEDLIFCYEDRLQRNVLTQCEAFARAYHEAMGEMVETRMRDAVLSIGSVWYSAWVDAGRPLLEPQEATFLVDEDEINELNKAYRERQAKGRAHE